METCSLDYFSTMEGRGTDTVTISLHRGCRGSADINRYLSQFASALNDHAAERFPFWFVLDGSRLGFRDVLTLGGDFLQAQLAFQSKFKDLMEMCTLGACVVRPSLLGIERLLDAFVQAVPTSKPFAFVASMDETKETIERLQSSMHGSEPGSTEIAVVPTANIAQVSGI